MSRLILSRSYQSRIGRLLFRSVVAEMNFCFVCGCVRDKKGVQAVPVCDALYAHPVCFITHQVFHVLNTGRADVCPGGGEWNIDWRSSMKKYVKPEVAAEVEKVLALLESNGIKAVSKIDKMEGVSERLLDAIKLGSTALTDMLLL